MEPGDESSSPSSGNGEPAQQASEAKSGPSDAGAPAHTCLCGHRASAPSAELPPLPVITLTVAPTTGGQFELKVSKLETIDNLKKTISKRLKVPKERICLLWKDRYVLLFSWGLTLSARTAPRSAAAVRWWRTRDAGNTSRHAHMKRRPLGSVDTAPVEARGASRVPSLAFRRWCEGDGRGIVRRPGERESVRRPRSIEGAARGIERAESERRRERERSMLSLAGQPPLRAALFCPHVRSARASVSLVKLPLFSRVLRHTL